MEDKAELRKLNYSFMAMAVLGQTISSLFSSPLFSAIITLYTLILLYFPSVFRDLVLSPVLISTSVLLFSLLRLGAAQRTSRRLEPAESSFLSREDCKSDPGQCQDPKSDPVYSQDFIEWDVRAPLEVIHEEEREEDGEGDALEGKRSVAEMGVIQRYASLSLYYPDSDSDTSSEEGFPVIGEWDTLETMCFRWEEEEERDELIEIALDGKRIGSEPEEDNLIEIDLSPER